MLKILFGWVVGALLLLQFIQIDIPVPSTPIDKNNEVKVSDEIMGMLKTSCYDCHSYETKIPWYGHVFPFSMEVKSHIKKGREWLNFQEWDKYSDEKKQKIYKGIVQTIDHKMPLPMYLEMHEDAQLTQIQRDEIKNWAQSNIK
ncbi:heme-binding domain-containing protein [Sulfurovum sp. zt1-1]|uniref:Heme-binding domain-containing protein n=1 Tax=Sulfurovum zhangzhouensis TaxID=3019067 RepID=A0ABT7QXU5_9BACT|nr:heme-binding domain-containing protein [Sulfurovum zhangzhouensis]MDM5271654.1 heme-binding domain-containing protein [Sulfurovum zhangzhouensis]